MRYLVVALALLGLSGCAVTDNFIKMDEVITGRTVCEDQGIFTWCVREDDPQAELIKNEG